MRGWNKALLCDSALGNPRAVMLGQIHPKQSFEACSWGSARWPEEESAEGSTGSRRGCGRASWAGTPLEFILCDPGQWQSVVLYCSLKYAMDFGTLWQFHLVTNVSLYLQHRVSPWTLCWLWTAAVNKQQQCMFCYILKLRLNFCCASLKLLLCRAGFPGKSRVWIMLFHSECLHSLQQDDSWANFSATPEIFQDIDFESWVLQLIPMGKPPLVARSPKVIPRCQPCSWASLTHSNRAQIHTEQ